MLKGKRTYIVAVLIGAAAAARALGWLSTEQYQVLEGLLVGAGAAALRAAVSPAAPSADQNQP